jgi:hypothetical protein
MTRFLHRRRLLGLGGAALGAGVIGGLAGCSPHPLYAPDAFGNGDPQTQAVQAQLREVQVALLPDRTGQLLRQALQSRLEAGETPDYARYNLAVLFNIAQIGLGVQNDSTITYIRFIATAPWALTSQDSTTHQMPPSVRSWRRIPSMLGWPMPSPTRSSSASHTTSRSAVANWNRAITKTRPDMGPRLGIGL